MVGWGDTSFGIGNVLQPVVVAKDYCFIAADELVGFVDGLLHVGEESVHVGLQGAAWSLRGWRWRGR